MLRRHVSGPSAASFGQRFLERDVITSAGMYGRTAGPNICELREPLADKTTGKKPPMRNPAKESRWHSGGGGLCGGLFGVVSLVAFGVWGVRQNRRMRA